MPLSYKWKRNGVYIPGELTNTYVVQVGDDTDTILCEVKGTNGIGSTLAYSNAVVIPDPKPSCTVNPIISGIPLEGQVLTVTSDGVWIGAPTITFSYQWRRNGVDIGGEVFNNYTLVAADAGCQIDCEVIGTNMYDSDTAYSNFLIPSASLIPPTIVTPPSITGTGTTAGSVLTINDGTWAGSPTITFSRQWLRNGSPISGETGTTYTLLATDVGDSIDCVLTATNPVTSVPYITYGIIVEGAPGVIQAPVIYGNYVLAGVLTLQNGFYSGYPTPTLSWVWQLSTNGGATWNNISGTTGSPTYTVQPGDVGNQIRVLETATNGIIPNVQSTSNVANITATAIQRPENTVAPAITGTPAIGNTLTCSTGTWNGSPTVFVRQWYRGTTPVGTNSANYTLVSADVDQIISCVVSATNAGGTEPATSNSIYAYDNDFYAVIAHAISNGYALPSTRQLQFFSTIATELKAYNQWTIHDILYCTYNDNLSGEAFARINWRNPSLHYLNPVNGPTWAANVGYTLNGSTQYIDTMYNPATNGVAYTLNSAGRYIWIQRPSLTATRVDGNSVSNDNTMLVGNGANNSINSGINLPASTNTSEGGFHAIVRTSSTDAYRVTNLTSASFTVNIASTAITSANQWIGRSGITYMIANAPIRFYAMGGAIPLANIFGFRSIINKLVNS